MPTKKLYNPINNWMSTPRASRKDSVYIGTATGSSVIGWKKKIKEKRDATSDYSIDAFKTLATKPIGARHVVRQITALADYGKTAIWGAPKTYSYAGYLLDATSHGFNHRLTVSSAVEAAALSEFYKKLRKEYQSMEGLTFLGELKETIHMLKHPMQGSLNATTRYLDAIKSQRRKARSRIKPLRSDTNRTLALRREQFVKDSTSSAWLEFQYGIRPFISDVQDIAKTAARAIHGRDRISTVRVRGISRMKPITTPVVTGYTLGDLFDGMMYRTWRNDKSFASVSYLAGIRKHVDGPISSLGELAQLSGLTLNNFVPTLYELMPYSFLIDYFSNLGDIISATFTDTSSIVWQSKTTRQYTEFELNESLHPRQDPLYYPAMSVGMFQSQSLKGNAFSERKFARTTVTRSRLSTMPIPPLVLEAPGLFEPKAVNIIALLLQAKSYRF